MISIGVLLQQLCKAVHGGGGLLTITGLESNDEFTGFALVGDHAGIGAEMSDASVITDYIWTTGGNGLGTGSSPTDFSAYDTGQPANPATLTLTATTAAGVFQTSVPIRAAKGVNTVAPVLNNDDPTGSFYGDTFTIVDDEWTGPDVFTIVDRFFGDDELLIEGTDETALDITEVHSGLNITATVRYITSGGTVEVAATGDADIPTFFQPLITGTPTVSGTLEVGQTLTLTPGAHTADPPSTRTWQAQRGATLIPGEFAGGQYTLQAADEGFQMTFIQIERNSIGEDTAASAATAVITVGAEPETITIEGIGPQASNGNIPVSYTITGDDASVELVAFPAALGAPAITDFNTGLVDWTGFVDGGTVSLTTGGVNILSADIPDGFIGVGRLALLPTNGAPGDIVVSGDVTINTHQVLVETGGAEGEVDYSFTPVGAETWRMSIYTSGATPSEADIIAGTGAVDSDTGTSTNGVEVTGTLLGDASTAYDTYFVFDGVVYTSLPVTSAAAPSVSNTRHYIGSVNEVAGGTSWTGTFDFTDVLEGDLLIVRLTKLTGTAGSGWSGCTVDGDAADVVTQSTASIRAKAGIFEIVADAAMAGNASVPIQAVTGNGKIAMDVWALRGTYTTVNVATPIEASGGNAAPRTNLDVQTNGFIFLAATAEDDNTANAITMTSSAPLEDDLFYVNTSADGHLFASGVAASTATISIGYDANNAVGANLHYAAVAAFYGA